MPGATSCPRCPGVWQQVSLCLSRQHHPQPLEEHLGVKMPAPCEEEHLKGNEATSNGNRDFTSTLGV